jgi:hypothetical protein
MAVSECIADKLGHAAWRRGFMAAICAGAAAGEAGDRVPQHPARADGTLRGLPVYVRKRDTFTLEILLILPRFALISAVDLVKLLFG